MAHQLGSGDATLAILAGGQGRRMGMPKGELKIAGKPILEYLLDAFAWPGPTVLVTSPGREHPTGWKQFNIEACDAVPNQGPLRGALTALENTTTPLAVIATVDMPGLATEHLTYVLQRLIDRNCMGLMLRRGLQIEPFPLACRASAATILSAQLERGKRSVHSLCDCLDFIVEDAPVDWPVSAWANLNLSADVREFGNLIQHKIM